MQHSPIGVGGHRPGWESEIVAGGIIEANVGLHSSPRSVFDELVLVTGSGVDVARAESRDKDGGGRFDITNVPGASCRVLDKARHIGHEILPSEVWYQALNRFHHRVILRTGVVPVVRLHGQQVQRGELHHDWTVYTLLAGKAFAIGVDAQDSKGRRRDILGWEGRCWRFTFKVRDCPYAAKEAGGQELFATSVATSEG